tara:strand:- start:9970 stop:11502 length:1533 start_codon:yes stop_codon:yes gene_type:complete
LTIFELKKKNIPLLLLLLLPVGFVVGPLVAELIINILIIIFLYNCSQDKNFYFFKNKIFIFFLFFYLFLMINLLFSNFLKESALNIFSYIRFIIFPFAICDILEKNKKNLKFVFLILSITIFIVVLDGYYQFIFDKNFLGYQKYRIDRISGFFKEDLILGSFLSRLLPLFIGLILFFKEDLKLTSLNLVIFLFAFILILLTGERASFLTASLALLIIIIQIKSYFHLRLILSFVTIFIVSFIMINNPIVSDRYFNQLKNHILGNPNTAEKEILPNYMPMIETSFKMFKENKLLGMGPKSYRYLCDDKRFITYFDNGTVIVDNTVLKINRSWKELRDLYLKKFYVSEGDIIKKNDKIFSYEFNDEKNTYFYLSDKEGRIEKIYKKEKYIGNDVVLDISPQNSPNTEYLIRNACNTHPHNFYIQLLGETGFIGFAFIFSLFIYLFYLLIKNFFFKYFKKKALFSDSEICILIGFFVVLWPLTTNGNFFNNWINLISFYPLGFFLYIFNKKEK